MPWLSQSNRLLTTLGGRAVKFFFCFFLVGVFFLLGCTLLLGLCLLGRCLLFLLLLRYFTSALIFLSRPGMHKYICNHENKTLARIIKKPNKLKQYYLLFWGSVSVSTASSSSGSASLQVFSKCPYPLHLLHLTFFLLGFFSRHPLNNLAFIVGSTTITGSDDKTFNFNL